jgi:hypothetical protein
VLSEVEVQALRDDVVRALHDWDEPHGFLLPTEPDPLERELCRERLRVARDVLNRVLAGFEPSGA